MENILVLCVEFQGSVAQTARYSQCSTALEQINAHRAPILLC